MIDKKFLYNTCRFGDKAKLASALATGIKDCCLDIGSPCIIDENLFHAASDNDLIPALFSFNYYTGERPNYIFNVKKKNVIVKSNKCIANNSIKTIDVFDFDKVKRLSECVNEQGSIILSLFNSNPHSAAKATGRSAVAFVDGMYENIIDRYLYHSVSYISYTKSTISPLGDLRYIIHFINIPNCVPVLNRRKIDGMGMVFNIVSLERTLRNRYMETVFCMSVIMSNYKENIFVIDGIDISEQSKVKLEYLLDAKNIIEKSMKQKKTNTL